MLEQWSNTIEARSVDGQLDAEHDVQSNSDFCRNANSSATKSPGAYRLVCVEVLLQLSRDEGRHLVEKLILILQKGGV